MIRTPRWLTGAEVEYIHAHAIDMAGGSAGLRDHGLLDSALARPQNLHVYGENDLFVLAACYVEALSRNHPFVDGNKRVGFTSASIFLLWNGYLLRPAEGDEHSDIVELVSQGKIALPELAAHLRRWSEPIRIDSPEVR